jgi:hypothetical protein
MGRSMVLADLTKVIQDHSYNMPVDMAESLYDEVILPLLEKEYRRGAIGWPRQAATHLDEHEAKENDKRRVVRAIARDHYHATMDADWLRRNADRMEEDDRAGQ